MSEPEEDERLLGMLSLFFERSLSNMVVCYLLDLRLKVDSVVMCR
jgi:hypothetical protein